MQTSLGRLFLILLITLFMGLVFSLQRVGAVPTPTVEGLLHFSNKLEFQNSFLGLELVDFNQSPVAPGAFTFCTSPIDENTNQPPDCFVPGDIPPGISFDSLPGNSMPINGAGFSTLTSTTVTLGTTPTTSQMVVSIPDGVNVVGLDLFAFSNGLTYQVGVYGAGDVLLETITTAGATTGGIFFGVYSDEPIVSLVLDNASNEIIDNVYFGNVLNVDYINDPDLFDREYPDLSLEDFEESPIADTTLLLIPEPLNSTTDIVGGFATGDILEGLSVGTVTKMGVNTLMIAGANFMGNQSVAVSQVNPGLDLEVSFTEPNVYQVGMDLMVNGPTPDKVQIIIYDVFNTIIGSTSVNVETSETFFGLKSFKAIGKIVALNQSKIELVDNIRFGGGPNGLTIYNDETNFMETINRFSHENFSESLANSIPSVEMCDEPLDKTSDNNCFAAGDIVHGVSFSTRDSLSCPNCIFAYSENHICGTFPKTIAAFDGQDILQIKFSEPTYYAGLTVHNDAIYAFVYAKDNRLLGAIYVPAYQCAGGFVGVKSLEPISKIVLGEFSRLVYLDSVIFGSSFPWSLVLPSIMTK